MNAVRFEEGRHPQTKGDCATPGDQGQVIPLSNSSSLSGLNPVPFHVVTGGKSRVIQTDLGIKKNGGATTGKCGVKQAGSISRIAGHQHVDSRDMGQDTLEGLGMKRSQPRTVPTTRREENHRYGPSSESPPVHRPHFTGDLVESDRDEIGKLDACHGESAGECTSDSDPCNGAFAEGRIDDPPWELS